MGPKKKPAAVVKKPAKADAKAAVAKAGAMAKVKVAKKRKAASTGRSEFITTVKQKALEWPLCGYDGEVECAHVGPPASDDLMSAWNKAMQVVYRHEEGEFGWCKQGAVQSNCLAMPLDIHRCYDNNNNVEGESSIIAFLPEELLPEDGIDAKPYRAFEFHAY
eukprot:4976161-Amphidinium_carterae.1